VSSCAFRVVCHFSMAVGNPAKVVGYIEDEDPSLTMKHGICAGTLGKHNFFLVIMGLC
jgi:hypothetical protein